MDMTNDAGFIRAIAAAPADDNLRLVYADWLEERGDLRGEFLRLAVALKNMPPDDANVSYTRTRLLQLRPLVSTDWLATAFPVLYFTLQIQCPQCRGVTTICAHLAKEPRADQIVVAHCFYDRKSCHIPARAMAQVGVCQCSGEAAGVGQAEVSTGARVRGFLV